MAPQHPKLLELGDIFELCTSLQDLLSQVFEFGWQAREIDLDR